MKKIPQLFLRDDNRKLLNEVTPGCEWVLNGEGKPTRKFDGTSCAIINNNLYKRYDNKKEKSVQSSWIHTGDTTKRGKNLYWIPIEKTDYYHIEAFKKHIYSYEKIISIHTYELCGPKINSNNEKLTEHVLIPHGKTTTMGDKYLQKLNPRTFEDIKEVLSHLDIEGIVWHHKDGRMCKILKKNFVFKRNIKIS